MSNKVLKLYNTFTRQLKPFEISGKPVQWTNGGRPPMYGSLYICGPTVYSECHLGHALTYIRADLLRRVMSSIFNVKLLTVMNITDIDDKILSKTMEEYPNIDTDNPKEHPFNRISDRYYKSFTEEMEKIRVQPPDLTMRVSRYTHLITKFISRLEANGQSYISPNGDVYFKVDSLPNYVGRTDSRPNANVPIAQTSKTDPRDFVLWKAAKPNEPVWSYQSANSSQIIKGRPGWHVQCSAISSAIFGNKLDIHYGGKDLIFPHHYNEEACCCAYHKLDTSDSLHVWTNHWLHSGHLVLDGTKMSKSLGNVLSISSLTERTSVNALRLLCIQSHYRADIQFSDNLFDKCLALDHKLKAFTSFLIDTLRSCQESLSTPDNDITSGSISSEMESLIQKVYNDIVDGVCEDLDLDKGLESVLDLFSRLQSKDSRSMQVKDIISVWSLLNFWCDTCGLEYGISDAVSNNDLLLDLLINYRQNVRTWAINELRTKKDSNPSEKVTLNNLLKECDRVRSQLDYLGFVSRDSKIKT